MRELRCMAFEANEKTGTAASNTRTHAEDPHARSRMQQKPMELEIRTETCFELLDMADPGRLCRACCHPRAKASTTTAPMDTTPRSLRPPLKRILKGRTPK